MFSQNPNQTFFKKMLSSSLNIPKKPSRGFLEIPIVKLIVLLWKKGFDLIDESI